MQMRFKEQTFQIARRLDEILGYYNYTYMGNPYPQRMADSCLESWGFPLDGRERFKQELAEERDVFRYFSSCQFGIVANGFEGLNKPSPEVILRAIHRYEAFLFRIHGVDLSNFETLNHRRPNREYLLLVKKEFRALKHYRFQVTLKAWYDKLPARIPTLHEKYPHLAETSTS